MSGRDPESLLALAAELDARDAELAERIALVRELLAGADAVRARAEEIAAFLDSLPAEREALARAADDAAARVEQARAALAAAERRRAELAGRRRAADRERADADVDRARADLEDVEARVALLAGQGAQLDEAERDRRAEAEGLVADGRSLAARIRQAPRVSEGGRAEPGARLEELGEWGSRAQAALLVVRGGLETERERVAREAGELGAVVLGEPPLAASVAAVRRRLEQALGT